MSAPDRDHRRDELRKALDEWRRAVSRGERVVIRPPQKPKNAQKRSKNG